MRIHLSGHHGLPAGGAVWVHQVLPHYPPLLPKQGYPTIHLLPHPSQSKNIKNNHDHGGKQVLWNLGSIIASYPTIHQGVAPLSTLHALSAPSVASFLWLRFLPPVKKSQWCFWAPKVPFFPRKPCDFSLRRKIASDRDSFCNFSRRKAPPLQFGGVCALSPPRGDPR